MYIRPIHIYHFMENWLGVFILFSLNAALSNQEQCFCNDVYSLAIVFVLKNGCKKTNQVASKNY